MDWPEEQIRISIFFSLSASVRSDDPEAFSSERIRKHVVDVVNKAYGPYAQKALGFILRTDGVNKDVGDQAAILLRKIATDQPATRQDASALSAAQRSSAANDAVSGIASSFPLPEKEDIQLLRSDPGKYAKNFDDVYGPGSSGKVLRTGF
jgi:hypothetical protein